MPDWFIALLQAVWHYLFAPRIKSDLPIYYLIWIGLFVMTNILWDVGTHRTKRFHLIDVSKKLGIVHQGSFFCSSLLLIIAAFNHGVWQMTEESYIPILIAGISGILASIPALCPYKLDAAGNVVQAAAD